MFVTYNVKQLVVSNKANAAPSIFMFGFLQAVQM
jgi:hypothetical protein